MQKKISVIAACCRSNGIGLDGRLPWNLKSEMNYFTRITSTVINKDTVNGQNDSASSNMQNAVVMGIKTYLSIPPKFRPLKNRFNVVLSRKASEIPTGAKYLCRSLDEAINTLFKEPNIDQIFIIGGAEVYAQAIQRPDCDQIFLTRIDNDYECDCFFPEIDLNHFEDITDEKLLPKYKKIVEDDYKIPLGVQTEGGVQFRYHLYKRKVE